MTKMYPVVLKSLIALVAIGLIFFAGRYALANLYANYVENSLEQWRELRTKQVTIENDKLEQVLVAAKQANSFHPNHPHYLILEAKVHQWQFLNIHDSDSESGFTSLSTSLDLLNEAAALRPHWPNTYADIVQVKRWLDQIDQEFNTAFELADRYGSMTAEVHLVLSQTGLQVWSNLSTSLRQLTTKHIALGLLHPQSRDELISFLKLNDRLAYGCALARTKVKQDMNFSSTMLPAVCRR